MLFLHVGGKRIVNALWQPSEVLANITVYITLAPAIRTIGFRGGKPEQT
jgi:hypothetical protein